MPLLRSALFAFFASLCLAAPAAAAASGTPAAGTSDGASVITGEDIAEPADEARAADYLPATEAEVSPPVDIWMRHPEVE